MKNESVMHLNMGIYYILAHIVYVHLGFMLVL